MRILNDILDLTRLETAGGELCAENFSPSSLTQSVVQVFAEKARERDLALIVDDAVDPAVVLFGDAGRIRQALWNLVSNAIKFTEAGSVTLAVRGIAANEREMTVRWTVTDTGIGIAGDRLGALFGDFVQADPSIQRRYGGTGLGLAITRRLIESLGGTVAATSTLGAGSTFVLELSLPLGRPDGEAVDEEAALADAVRRRLLQRNEPARALVVEDDPASRCYLTSLLRGLQFRVDEVGDGRAALDAFARTRYDLIFMDMQLPKSTVRPRRARCAAMVDRAPLRPSRASPPTCSRTISRAAKPPG